ncbi:type II toxin-antitoxin system RelE/ParE family toxin [Pareuzebyella sediminis]|uniref:type II toxin-antitoxin system RelE/ParE family toxin n=1 Tax=Pareuzebyella sediminis TaxID=2607998 RepID=UPI0011EF172A|nr:type II toxin-antitoxin system RelE/ParE family toxin [Pareuzebyella sediminis]
MKVVWTQKAEKSFNGIVDYLLDAWTAEIAISFSDLVDHTEKQIVKNPKRFKVSEYDKMSREALITKHTTVFYRILNNCIEIEYFWGQL